MQYKLFHFSIPCELVIERDLNSFLAGHWIVNVMHHLVTKQNGAMLVFVVEYLAAKNETDGKAGGGKTRIDYRDKLSENYFEIFRQLRDLRKQIAEAEGIPGYTVFTNAQLALYRDNKNE